MAPAGLAEDGEVAGKRLLVVEDAVTSAGQIGLSVNDLRDAAPELTQRQWPVAPRPTRTVHWRELEASATSGSFGRRNVAVQRWVGSARLPVRPEPWVAGRPTA